MLDPLLALSTFLCLLMAESRKITVARFSLAFFGLFLSSYIILYRGCLAGLLLLFNISFFSATLLAVSENRSGLEEFNDKGVFTRSKMLRTLFYFGGFAVSLILFRDFLSFNLAVGAGGLLRRSAERMFIAFKTIESNVYAVLMFHSSLSMWEVLLFNILICASSTLFFLLFLKR